MAGFEPAPREVSLAFATGEICNQYSRTVPLARRARMIPMLREATLYSTLRDVFEITICDLKFVAVFEVAKCDPK